MPKFEELQDELGWGKLPDSCQKSLRQMNDLIQDSESPADVAIALTLGLGAVLSFANDEQDILNTIVKSALAIKNIMNKGIADIQAKRDKKQIYDA